MLLEIAGPLQCRCVGPPYACGVRVWDVGRSMPSAGKPDGQLCGHRRRGSYFGHSPRVGRRLTNSRRREVVQTSNVGMVRDVLPG